MNPTAWIIGFIVAGLIMFYFAGIANDSVIAKWTAIVSGGVFYLAAVVVAVIVIKSIK